MTKIAYIMTAGALLASGMAFAAPDRPTSGKTPPPPPPAPTKAVDDGEPVFATDAVSDGVAASAPGNLPAFSFDDVPLPETATGRGGRGGDSGAKSEVRQKLAAVPVGKSWLETVEEPADTITDAAEREKAFNEAAAKVQNRIQGDIRRHKKVTGNENHSFSVLRVNDDKRGRGVRIYRNADKAAKAAEQTAETPAAPVAA